MKRPISPYISRHYFVLLVVVCVPLAIVSWQQPDKAAPYKFEYPPDFGTNFVIPASNTTTVEGVNLGRMLFYEKRLSANGKISCASCHKQAYAFADNRRYSVGYDGSKTSRNAMALVNLLWVEQFFWDGRVNGLEDQAVVPLTHPHEMGQPLAESVEKLNQTPYYPRLFKKAFGTGVTATGVVRALAQFERTLISAASAYDRYLGGQYIPTASERRGMDLFMGDGNDSNGFRSAGCSHCHGGAKMYKELFHNNGLDTLSSDAGRLTVTERVEDRGRFRVTTLRNIALTAPYMHDGRFATLEDVLDHYSDHLKPSETLSTFLTDENGNIQPLKLTTVEKADIISFLQMLTDSAFISNPVFSNPFNY